MRVAHVVAQFHPGPDRVGAKVLRLACEQRMAGINAEVVTLDRVPGHGAATLPAFDCVQGVPVRRIGFIGPASHPVALHVLSCLEPFDLVHVHGTGFFCHYLAATRLLHRKPMVASPHLELRAPRRGRLRRAIGRHTVTKLALRRYLRVIAGTLDERSHLQPMSRRRLLLIDDGIDTAGLSDAAAHSYAPQIASHAEGMSLSELEHLLAAFAELAIQIPEAHLHLVCGADGLPATTQQALETLGIASAVSVHSEPDTEQLRCLFAQCSFYASAARSETALEPLVQALAAGLLPVVARTAGHSRVLAAGDAGIVLDYGDTARAGSDMATFMHTAAEQISDRRAAAMQLAATFSWPVVVRRQAEEYERILGSRRRRIIGVTIRHLGRNQAVATIDRALTAGERLNVGFVNAHSLNIASRNPAFRDALQGFLVLNDGLGLDIASRIKFGKPFTANLNGTDFVPEFLGRSRHRLRIYMIGTTDAVISEAARRFQARFPWHTIVGRRNGFFTGPDDIEETCQKIRSAEADCVLVGMGNPLQELWIAEHGAKTGARLMFGVGALFDFEAGRVPRAPQWVRQMRCEWMYRLAQEPTRLLRRYLVGNVAFLIRVIADARS